MERNPAWSWTLICMQSSMYAHPHRHLYTSTLTSTHTKTWWKMIGEDIRCQPLPPTCTQTHTKKRDYRCTGDRGGGKIICMQNLQVKFKWWKLAECGSSYLQSQHLRCWGKNTIESIFNSGIRKKLKTGIRLHITLENVIMDLRSSSPWHMYHITLLLLTYFLLRLNYSLLLRLSSLTICQDLLYREQPFMSFLGSPGTPHLWPLDGRCSIHAE